MRNVVLLALQADKISLALAILAPLSVVFAAPPLFRFIRRVTTTDGSIAARMAWLRPASSEDIPYLSASHLVNQRSESELLSLLGAPILGFDTPWSGFLVLRTVRDSKGVILSPYLLSHEDRRDYRKACKIADELQKTLAVGFFLRDETGESDKALHRPPIGLSVVELSWLFLPWTTIPC